MLLPAVLRVIDQYRTEIEDNDKQIQAVKKQVQTFLTNHQKLALPISAEVETELNMNITNLKAQAHIDAKK